MKSIEERAEEIYKGNTIEEDAYKRGAEEQKAIDINKALSFLRYYGEGDFSCMEEFEAKFRKAMEG